MQTSDSPDTLADDLLDGAEAISKFLGPKWPKWRVYYAAAHRVLPIAKVGKSLTARKSRLRRYFDGEQPADADKVHAVRRGRR